MRVLVAPDRMGAIPAEIAGAAIARGWHAAGNVEVAVVPCGDAGAGFVDAVGAYWRVMPTLLTTGDPEDLATCVQSDGRVVLAVEPATARPPGFHPDASSAPIGRAVREVLGSDRPRQLVIDLTGTHSHDGGVGLLAELGATADVPLTDGVAGLRSLTRIDTGLVTDALAGVELIGVIPVAEARQHFLGLRGITSRRGTELGLDPALMLRTDASLEKLATLVNPAPAGQPGAGACGGLAWAIAALGGRIVTAVDLLGEWTDLPDTARLADVVVTGTTAFDFHAKGGGVVDRVAAWAADALRPCLVLAGEVMISSREMRLMGIDAAYPVELHDPDRLEQAVSRVARSWSWS